MENRERKLVPGGSSELKANGIAEDEQTTENPYQNLS